MDFINQMAESYGIKKAWFSDQAHFICYYVRLEEFELAHYFISMAYECNNKNDYVSYVYSKSLLNNGKKDKAEQILMDILKRNPDYKKARKELNLLYNGQ